jgi:hypothetical protein
MKMSVENQLEDATTASRVQQEDKSHDVQGDDSTGGTNESTSAKDELHDSQGSIGSFENDQEIAVSSQARDWFKGLTSEERSGAIGFTDGAFLGAFFSFASPWSAKTTGAGATSRVVGGKYCSLRGLYVVYGF